MGPTGQLCPQSLGQPTVQGFLWKGWCPSPPGRCLRPPPPSRTWWRPGRGGGSSGRAIGAASRSHLPASGPPPKVAKEWWYLPKMDLDLTCVGSHLYAGPAPSSGNSLEVEVQLHFNSMWRCLPWSESACPGISSLALTGTSLCRLPSLKIAPATSVLKPSNHPQP